MLKELNKVLKKYDIEIKENGREEFSFIKKNDLQKIAELDESILDSKHNSSPTIKEFISINEQILFGGRIDNENGKLYVDVDTVYIPLELENRKFNKVMEKVRCCSVDSIEKTTENYKDYICLWWD